MSSSDPTAQLFTEYESFLKTLTPKVPKGLVILFAVFVAVLGWATVYHRVLKRPFLPYEVDVPRSLIIISGLVLVVFPAIRKFRNRPDEWVRKYKNQIKRDEDMIHALRACADVEHLRIQKYLTDEWRIEEKQFELWAFVFALLGSLFVSFRETLESGKVPYASLLILVTGTAMAIAYAKLQTAQKRRFADYLDAAQ